MSAGDTALLNLIRTRVGQDADAASATGSTHGKLKELLTRLSATRTGYLDNLNGLVASRLDAAVTSRAAPGAEMALTAAERAATADAIWDEATSGHATAGTYGKLITDNLDAAISSRATPGAAMALTTAERDATADAIWDEATSGHVTAGSFGKFVQDRLDAAVSTRAPGNTALSNATWTDSRAGKLDNLDALLSSRATPQQVYDQLNAASPGTPTAGSVFDDLDVLLGRLTATRAGYLDVAISTRAPGSTALSNATWTDARAGYLDNLSGLVASRLDTTVTSRATPSDVDAQVNARLNAASPGTPTAGSVYDELDVLLGRLTSTRAGYLDNLNGLVASRLDTTVSSRLAASSYVAPDNAGIDDIQAKVGSNGDAASMASTLFAGQQAVYDLINGFDHNVDVAVSSRLAASSYVAPDNAGIGAIKAKTDQFADPARLDAAISSRRPSLSTTFGGKVTTTSSTYVTAFNVSGGPGRLRFLIGNTSSGNVYLKITVDGGTPYYARAATVRAALAGPPVATTDGTGDNDTMDSIWGNNDSQYAVGLNCDIEFKTSLLIEWKVTGGTGTIIASGQKV